MSKAMSVDVAGILAAIVYDFGGEIAISAEALGQNFEGKGLVPEYLPEKDLYILRLEDVDYLEEEDV